MKPIQLRLDRLMILVAVVAMNLRALGSLSSNLRDQILLWLAVPYLAVFELALVQCLRSRGRNRARWSAFAAAWLFSLPIR